MPMLGIGLSSAGSVCWVIKMGRVIALGDIKEGETIAFNGRVLSSAMIASSRSPVRIEGDERPPRNSATLGPTFSSRDLLSPLFYR